MNGTAHIPAPSLRELARPTGVTEGVSSDGCSGPTIYTPAHINSETFERLRSSKYTPSVSHSLDSSLREGAGDGCTIQPTAQKPQRCGRFSSPTKAQRWVDFTIQRSTLPQSRIRSTAPSEREPGDGCTIQPTAQKPQRCGRFSSPLRNCEFSTPYEYGVHSHRGESGNDA